MPSLCAKLESPDSLPGNDERGTQFVMGAKQFLNLSHRNEVPIGGEYLGCGLLNHDRTLPHYSVLLRLLPRGLRDDSRLLSACGARIQIPGSSRPSETEPSVQ